MQRNGMRGINITYNSTPKWVELFQSSMNGVFFSPALRTGLLKFNPFGIIEDTWRIIIYSII